MPSRRRKRSSPQRLEGENAIKRKEFAFIIPRSSANALQPVDENSEVSCNIPASQQASSDPRELTSSAQLLDPAVSIPVYSPSSRFQFHGIPIAKLSVRLEQRCDLGGFLNVPSGLANFSLQWTAGGKQLVKIEVGADTISIPAKIEPDLSFDGACVVRSLVHTKQGKLARLFFSADSSDCCFREIELWASDSICEYEYSSVVPRKSIVVDRCKAMVDVLYPGLCTTHMEGGLVSPSKHQLSIVAKIRQFYTDVQRRRLENLGGTSDPELDPSSLLPHLTAVLRGYQCRAVAWMMRREGVVGEGVEEVEVGGRDPLHMLWMEIPTSVTGLDCPVYYNPHTGEFSNRRFPPAVLPKGGILADEMGLGKTVEMLALILAHKWPGEDREHSYSSLPKEVADSDQQPASSPSKQPPVCIRSPSKVYQSPVKDVGSSGPHDMVKCLCGATSEGNYQGEFVQCERCLVWQHSKCADFHTSRHDTFVCIKCLLDKPLPAGATLIISPTSIAQQWEDEIRKHTQPGALKVLQYRGVSQKYVSPFELVSYDIVLVAYETLRTEVDHANSHELSRVLRHQKRHTCPPSPLPAVKWWRICLDEAQLVESTHTKAAEMTQKLSGVNHWCVTGTPVMKDLTDLYGLVVFLGVDPYSQLFWFNRLVWHPFMLGREGPMISLFSKLMWRNSKADVADELQLPDQMEEIHWLHFSAVEAYFYRRQQQTCTSDLAKVLAYLPESSLTLSSLLQSTVQKLMTPLHRLRQACCHPQIVRGGYLPINISSKNCLTMPELLDKLIMQAKVEAREELRQLVATLNGLAGIFILKEEWDCAVENYREAMLAWQEHEKHDVDCDKLQRIHTMENLSQLLREGRAGNSHTLRDDHLIEDAKVLRDKYSEKPEAQVRAAVEGLVVSKQAIDSAKLEANWAQAEYLGELPMDEGCGEELARGKGCGEELGELARDKGCGEDLVELAGGKGCGDTSVCVSQANAVQPPEQISDGTKSEEVLGELARGECCGDPASDSNSGDDSSGACQSCDSTHGDSADTIQPIRNVGSTQSQEMSSSEPSADTPATNQPKRKPVTPSCPWWLSLLQWVDHSVHGQELLEAVNTELSSNQEFPNIRINFRHVEGMQLFLCSHMDKIEGCRGRLLETLDELSASPSDDLVVEVGACHLRPDSMQGDEMCLLCVTEEISIAYERLLFARYHAAEEGHMRSEHGDGSRALSIFERILRCLLSFVKHKRAPALLLGSAQAFLAYLEALKKEYKAIRALWLAADKRLCACDELRMASSRLRLMTPYEILLGFDVPSTINPFEVDFMVSQFITDKLVTQDSLKKCVRQVLYLKNLTKTQEQQGESAQVCPVCTRHLGGEWGVFTCGHPLCMECIFTMVNMRRRHMYTSWGYREEVPIKCPLCRVPSLSTEIHYVRTGSEEDKQFPIKGSHSTKIIGVTRALMNIQQQEPGAKALVFSSWLDILELIARAMRENDIKFSFLKTKSTFQENLATFKTSPDINVLLLPFHSGSKGLNIVEATHVLLVEPSLNIGVELQAIGRVHRMGQTKPTTVHRFYVKDSVEERIYNLLNSEADKTKFLISNERESTLTVAEIQHLLQE